MSSETDGWRDGVDGKYWHIVAHSSQNMDFLLGNIVEKLVTLNQYNV